MQDTSCTQNAFRGAKRRGKLRFACILPFQGGSRGCRILFFICCGIFATMTMNTILAHRATTNTIFSPHGHPSRRCPPLHDIFE